MSLDPFAPSFRQNPYPLYARLREMDPVHWCAREAWLVTRHADVAALLDDERLDHWRAAPSGAPAESYFERVLDRWLELMDPRNRSRLRRLTQRVFAPGRIDRLEGEIEATAGHLLRQAETRGGLDVVQDFADPLTLSVIARLLGVPAQEGERFRCLAAALVGNVFQLLGTGSAGAAGDRAVHDFGDFLESLIAARERCPGEDLISALFEAREAGDEILREDFLALAILFLFAGHENMMNFLGNAALALLRHPGQLARLREDPSLLPRAVEELLRYESPVQLVSVTANTDFPFGGRAVLRGQRLLLALGSANRDPECFPDPDALDLGRRADAHLAFGRGPLFCLGAPLARLEGRIALGTLIRSKGRLRLLTGVPAWRESPALLRGLKSLPIAFGPATAEENV